jgi:hypothetical protein
MSLEGFEAVEAAWGLSLRLPRRIAMVEPNKAFPQFVLDVEAGWLPWDLTYGYFITAL